jgi:hypothetical protein
MDNCLPAVHGRLQGKANTRARNLAEDRRVDRGQVRGYSFIHHAVDDHFRFVYSEILPDETKETASAFMRNAINAFASLGVKVRRVLTDNGACYRSQAFAEVLTDAGISHKSTRPYRAPNQRQGGTLQPDPPGGMGLRQGIQLRKRTPCLLPGLHRALQSQQAPHRPQRCLTCEPRHQPTGLVHLICKPRLSRA